jgi:regulation of enolase protein 1 (concanavalin A-like superfamily)
MPTCLKSERKLGGILLACTILALAAGAENMADESSPERNPLLDESFDGPKPDTRLKWLNPPPVAEIRNGWLSVEPTDKSDFWRKTVTGESADSGHLLYVEISGDFVAETKVAGDFAHQYDHAGLMLRQDATHWLKADAENDPVGTPTLGVVVTRETSDWSVSRPAPKEYLLRLERRGDLVEVKTSDDGGEWSLLRQLTFPLRDPVKVGLFAACPIKAGFHVRFDYLRITRPQAKK